MGVMARLLLDILHNLVSAIVLVVGLHALILTTPMDSSEKIDVI